jgi:gliding motility-associated-like protein
LYRLIPYTFAFQTERQKTTSGMAILRILMCLWLCAAAPLVHAQLATTGTDFWFGFFENSTDGLEDALVVTITAQSAASGVVSIPGQNWQQSFYVSAAGSTQVEVPQFEGEVETEQFVDNRAIHVESNAPISVFATNYALSSGDASRILPTPLLGTKYIAASYAGLSGSGSQLLIVGTENGTEVQITPSVTTSAGDAAGIPFTVQLEAGQCYRLVASGSGDLTGTQVFATSASGKCRPFAVFGGAVCANIPSTCTYACDHLYEQLYDLEKWGTSYIITPFDFVINPSYSGITAPRYSYRILASENSTQIIIDDVTAIVLQAGQFQEYTNETEPHFIEADRPIQVIQYMQGISCGGNGDPAMIVLDDVDSRTVEAVIGASDVGIMDVHYVNIVVSADGLGAFAIDGSSIPVSQFEPIGNADAYWTASFELTSGQHVLECPAGFNGIQYGHSGSGAMSASYAESIPVVKNVLEIDFEQSLCTNAAASLQVPANYTSPRWYYANDPTTLISTTSTLALTAPIQNAIYELHADDILSGCVDTFYFNVASPDPIPITIAQDQLSVCSFEQVTLTAHALPSSAIYEYTWFPEGTIVNEDPSMISVQAEENATYQVMVSTIGGCAQTIENYTLLVTPGSVASFNLVEESVLLCEGQSVDLHVQTEQVIWNDNFDPAISWGDWQSILGGVESNVCGTVGGNGLYFNGSFPREAITQPLNFTGGATVYFSLKIANGTAPCDDAEPGDNVTLAYSVANGPWITVETYYESAYPDFEAIAVVLPAAAWNANTRLRWRQSGSYAANQDNWVLEDAYVGQQATASFTYAWSPAAGLTANTGSTVTATPSLSSWYDVTTADPANGCDYVDSVFIDVGPQFTLAVTPDETICIAQDLQITAIPNQPGSYTYTWAPTSGLQGPFAFNPIADVSQTETYTVQVVSDYGCQAQGQVTITLGSVFELNLQAVDDSICAGDQVEIQASLSGQTNGITLTWSGDPTISNTQAATITASPQQDVTLFCLAEQLSTGCSVTEEMMVDVTPAFSVTLSPGVIQTCEATGTAVQASVNLTESVEWNWSPGAWVADSALANTTLATESSGSLTVMATTASGCSASASVEIEVSPLITDLGPDIGLCIGESALLEVDWPTSYSVTWSTGATGTALTVATTDVYSVEVIAPDGCTSRDTLEVIVYDYPELDLGPDTSFCDGEELRLTASDPGLDYLWNTGQLSRQINVTAPGVYSVQVTNGYCFVYDSIEITVNPLPVEPFLASYTTCFEAATEPYYLDAENQGCTYVWSNDSTQRLLEVGSPGTYAVTVITAEGCSLNFETSVEQECLEALYAPTSFTPDGDGINDAWFVYGLDIVNFHVQIYNRWGELFFESDDLNTPWLGQRRDGNQFAPAEAYDYVIRYQKIEDDGSRSLEQVIRGTVLLIR